MTTNHAGMGLAIATTDEAAKVSGSLAAELRGLAETANPFGYVFTVCPTDMEGVVTVWHDAAVVGWLYVRKLTAPLGVTLHLPVSKYTYHGPDAPRPRWATLAEAVQALATAGPAFGLPGKLGESVTVVKAFG